jgi:orotate phosphoribosyltransferase-like protein
VTNRTRTQTLELIETARDLYESGFLHREIAEQLSVSRSTVSRWLSGEDYGNVRQRAYEWRWSRKEKTSGRLAQGS